jgi:hypothetical protein
MKKILFALAFIMSCGFCFSQNTVADIEFGKTSYEEAVPKLTYRFGEPAFEDTDNRIIIFAGLRYSGFWFDRAWFFFESTTSHNVFNKCWMIANFNNAKEAKDFRDNIASKVGEKYNVEAKIDPETKFKDYYVGTSPTDSTKPYMKISTRSDGNGTYTTGIDYGPFEYINENFQQQFQPSTSRLSQ